MNLLRIAAAGWLLIGLLSPRAHADDAWPQFRGPTAMGVAADHSQLPDTWSATENVQWKTEIQGWGWSNPIVWGNQIFLTSVSSDDEYERPKKGLYKGGGRRDPPDTVHHWHVYCLDTETGKILWQHKSHEGQPASARHPKNTYASETPVTDGQRLYVLFGDLGLYCYDLQGNLLWSQSIEPKKTLFDYGAAASPVLCEDQVVIVYDNQEDSFIAAFDTETGEPRWRTPRDEKSTWATPHVWKNELRTEIVTPGKRKIRSYGLDGGLLWELDVKMSNLVIPSPFSACGLLFVTSGYVGDQDRPIYAIRPGGAGDITPPDDETTSEFLAWHLPQAGPYNPSPIVYGDYYYTLFDRGFLTCHDARTGEEIYGKKRFAPGASFTASPWAYNGKLFFLSEDGDTYVVEAGSDFKLLQTNPLEELCLASPAIAQGKLFLRTASKLYCITQQGPPIQARSASK